MQTATQPDSLTRLTQKRPNLQTALVLTTTVGLAFVPIFGIGSETNATMLHRALEPMFQSSFTSDGTATPIAFPSWSPAARASTLPSFSPLESKSAENSVAQLRDTSGLTADQLGRLFGVSRRSIQNWIAGGAMASQHQERLSFLLTAVAELGDSPENRRASLLSSSNGMSLFHRLVGQTPSDAVIQASSLTVRDRLGA